MPLSQIHYHFGSKQDMVLALFEYLNAQLLDRQNALFGDATLKLSEQWDKACDYLDEDIASGYVRVMQELTAASWSIAAVAKVVRAGMMGWLDLITGLRAKPGANSAGSARSLPKRSVLSSPAHSSALKVTICLASRSRVCRFARRFGVLANSFASQKVA